MVRSLLQQETTSTARSFSLDINESPLWVAEFAELQ